MHYNLDTLLWEERCLERELMMRRLELRAQHGMAQHRGVHRASLRGLFSRLSAKRPRRAPDPAAPVAFTPEVQRSHVPELGHRGVLGEHRHVA